MEREFNANCSSSFNDDEQFALNLRWYVSSFEALYYCTSLRFFRTTDIAAGK